MSNLEEKNSKLENSTLPNSIPSTGYPIMEPILKTPNFENQEVNKKCRIGDENDDNLENCSIPVSIDLIGCPIIGSISNNPKLENLVSVCCSEDELKKRQRNDDESENCSIPVPINGIGCPIIGSISNSPKFETLVSVSQSTDELMKKRRLSGDENEEILKGSPNLESFTNRTKSENHFSKRRRLGEEIEENDDGFTTPTDSDHRIPVPVQCPPAPKKPNSRKSKSPPGSGTVNRRIIFPVDISDNEAESMFPPRVGDLAGDSDVA